MLREYGWQLTKCTHFWKLSVIIDIQWMFCGKKVFGVSFIILRSSVVSLLLEKKTSTDLVKCCLSLNDL